MKRDVRASSESQGPASGRGRCSTVTKRLEVASLVGATDLGADAEALLGI